MDYQMKKKKKGIAQSILNEKIIKALSSIGSFKLQERMDSMHSSFKKCWDLVGSAILNELQTIFRSQIIPEEINKTQIILIPKKNGAETISQYKPISLCTTLYKIVSKVLVNRLRPLLLELVHPSQAGFVLGRKARDNAILLNELLHGFTRKKEGERLDDAKD